MSDARGGFTLLQLMLAVALVGIVLGFVAAVRREARSGGGGTVAFSPDGERFVVGYWDGRIAFGDTSGGRLGRSHDVKTLGITALAFSPDGGTLALGGNDQVVRLWDVQGQREVRGFEGKAQGFSSIAFSRDGRRIASGSYDGEVVVWDVATGNTLSTLNHGETVIWLAFVPGANRLVTQSESTIKVWDLDSGSVRPQYGPQTKWSAAAAISPNGRTLAVAESDVGVVLYDVATAERQAVLASDADLSPNVAFAADGATLVTYGWNGIGLWNMPEGTRKRTLNASDKWLQSESVWISRDGHRLQAFTWPKQIRAWDVPGGALRMVWVRATPLLSWVLLLGAWYLWTLAWIAVMPDSTAAAARLRARVAETDWAERIAWHDRPAWFVLLGCGGLVLAVANGFLGIFEEWTLDGFGSSRPAQAIALGLVMGVAFFGQILLGMRKFGALLLEAALLRTRRRLRRDVARHEMAFAALAVGMLATTAAVALVVGVSPYTAFFASLSILGLLYWEQGRIARAAEARMAERGAKA